MSESNSTPPASKPVEPTAAARLRARTRVWNVLQLPLAVLVAVAALTWLLWPERRGEESAAAPKKLKS